jgi:proteasome lid subunit RPN8/RPN11
VVVTTLVELDPPATTGAAFAVTAPLWHAMLAHARAAAPEECCAVGIGEPGHVRELHLVPNVHPTPVTRYEIASADQLAVFQRGMEHGWDTTLVFHSHPATEPVPSATDRQLAAWPDAVYAILSLANPVAPLLRAWRISDGAAVELPVELPAQP